MPLHLTLRLDLRPPGIDFVANCSSPLGRIAGGAFAIIELVTRRYSISVKEIATVLSAFLFLAACGKQDMGEFAPMAARFQAEGASRGKAVDLSPLSIKYGELEPGENGRCEWDIFGHKTIVLKEAYWQAIDENAREALLFHELGHCLFDRTHLNEQLHGSAVPASLMHENTMRSAVYVDNRNRYLDELFLQSK